MNRKEYWYSLCNIEGIGSRKIRRLLDLCRDPEGIFKCREEVIEKSGVLTKKEFGNFLNIKKNIKRKTEEYHKLNQDRIQFITIDDGNYPKRFSNLYDKPYGLYVKGSLPEDQGLSVAIIGARHCTNYGWETAKFFGKELAEAGVQIISGMALGIDGAGQRGALHGNGKTFAILGSGIDICYPKENKKLYEEIQMKGGIISEYAPGIPPFARNFPMRNRLISGLSDCVIIIEAKKKSGSQITVDLALEQGKDIFAVPGRITDLLSTGCNELIHSGANILLSPNDILDFCGWDRLKSEEKREKDSITLAPEEKLLYSCLNLEPKHIEVILRESSLDLQDAIGILLSLEQKSLVVMTAGCYYFRTGIQLSEFP